MRAAVLAGVLLLASPAIIPEAKVDAAGPTFDIEEQAWWADPLTPMPGRHVHVRARAWPAGVVSGTIAIPIEILLHNQPVGATLGPIRANDFDHGHIGVWTKGAVVGEVRNYTWTVNTDNLSTGRHLIRVGAYVNQPDGKQQLVSGEWALYVRAMTPLNDRGDKPYYLEGRGWYTGIWGYANARLLTPPPTAPLTKPWVGVFQTANPSGRAIVESVIAYDAHIHEGDPGQIVATSFGPGKWTVTIDPAKFESGFHRIMWRATAKSGAEANSGISVLGFNVP